EWLTDEETRRFSDVLDQAVRRCLSLGRAGIFLSGGFDSVSIAAVAADLSRKAGVEPPAALSLAFPDPTCNEQNVQRGVANALGLPFKLADFQEAACHTRP